MIITIKKGDKMSYCREALRVLSGDGPVMVAAEYRRKQDMQNIQNRHTMPG